LLLAPYVPLDDWYMAIYESLMVNATSSSIYCCAWESDWMDQDLCSFFY